MEIKKVLRLLGPLIVEGVLSVRNLSHERLIEMLHELPFMTRSINTRNNSVVIELQILDVDMLYRLLAGEANKFLLASRVSHQRSTQNQYNNASWQAVENYYAAYYGVHYLLRLTGVSVTSLDAQNIECIVQSYYARTLNFSIPSGLYVMQYDDATKVLTLTNIKKSGGSHQSIWQQWETLIEKLCSQTNSDPREYAAISIDLTEHKQFLKKSTAKYNPPEIRGEINYQFKGGAWVFEKNSEKSIGFLQRSIAGADLQVPLKASTPASLIANNKIIISLAKAVFVDASEKYPKSICRALFNKYKSYVS